MYLVVGLGNPGKKYEHTRHNVGYDALDVLAKKLNISIDKSKFKGLYGQGNYKDNKIFLLKPETYMNLSGESVILLKEYFSIDNKNIIVLVDDIDIEFGQVKIKAKGSAGTHNGLKSIIKSLNTMDFPRIKISVNKKPAYMDLADFVLSKFSKEEQKIVNKQLDLASDAVIEMLESGLDAAMNTTNSKRII